MRVEPLDDGDHLLLTTFERDGTAAPTPVRYAGANGRYVCRVAADDETVLRIRDRDRAEVAACSARGRITPGAAILAATVQELDPADHDQAERRLAKKSGLGWRTANLARRSYHKARSQDPTAVTYLEIVLSEAI